MFSFFQRSKYLVDLLEGFVDIHNHILPGIDDGAKDVNDSMVLLKSFAEIGIKDFIATPHIMNDYYGNNISTIQSTHKLLKEEVAKSNLDVNSIRFAAEYMIDANFENLLENKELLTLKSNYILMEMSYYQAPLNLDEVVFKTFSQGYLPILAHPERYSFFHSRPEQYKLLKKQGIPFQLNILALGNHYGSSINKMAYKLLEAGMYDFVGTDTHHIAHLTKIKEIKMPEKKLKLIRPLIEKTKSSFSSY